MNTYFVCYMYCILYFYHKGTDREKENVSKKILRKRGRLTAFSCNNIFIEANLSKKDFYESQLKPVLVKGPLYNPNMIISTLNQVFQ